MRRREILKRLEKFTCPHCGALVGCDELGKLGMYSLKIYSRHVERCQEIVEAMRAADAKEAERLRDDLP
jgi:hypothetical protein